MNTPPPVPTSDTFRISRSGNIILELEGPAVWAALKDGQVRGTDHYWTNGMASWELVASRTDWEQMAIGPASPVVAPSAMPRRSMSGRVLEFNIATSSGLISGADGVRYPFAGQEWRSPSAMPQAGMNVDFESDGRAAYGVFVLTEAASASPAGSGFYRSSDNKLLGGVCGGLAHKWGSNPVLLRIIALFVPVGIPIYIVMWLSLAERPTGK